MSVDMDDSKQLYLRTSDDQLNFYDVSKCHTFLGNKIIKGVHGNAHVLFPHKLKYQKKNHVSKHGSVSSCGWVSHRRCFLACTCAQDVSLKEVAYYSHLFRRSTIGNLWLPYGVHQMAHACEPKPQVYRNTTVSSLLKNWCHHALKPKLFQTKLLLQNGKSTRCSKPMKEHLGQARDPLGS